MRDNLPVKLDGFCYVSGQIHLDLVRGFVSDNIRLLINNRPDHEDFSQPTAAETAAAATAAGIGYLHLTMGPLSTGLIAEAREAIATAPGATLLYCRSGLRSALLWAAVRVSEGAAVEEVLAGAAAAGFDLRHYRPTLAGIAADVRPG